MMTTDRKMLESWLSAVLGEERMEPARDELLEFINAKEEQALFEEGEPPSPVQGTKPKKKKLKKKKKKKRASKAKGSTPRAPIGGSTGAITSATVAAVSVARKAEVAKKATAQEVQAKQLGQQQLHHHGHRQGVPRRRPDPPHAPAPLAAPSPSALQLSAGNADRYQPQHPPGHRGREQSPPAPRRLL
jgi:hypothetical protein